jgi:eukaryotic-like serine/threonine-protein kinase
MGDVYLARDTHLGRNVALKLLRHGRELTEGDRRRFKKEAAALARLNHPNIATIHDFDSDDEIDFLVMEYVEGITLDAQRKRESMSEKELLAIALQVVSAVRAAHDANIIHRDLKPQNIMLDERGAVRVLDFGIARLLPPESAELSAKTVTIEGLQAGTLRYMSPERLEGAVADARSDLFAVGAVLYEMATGQMAFDEEQAPRLVDAILHTVPPPVRAINRRISTALESIIAKCLDSDPDRRYQSARELEVDLLRQSDVLAGHAPTSSSRTGSRPRGWRLSRRSLVGACVLAVATLIVVGVMLRPGPALSFAARDWILVADFDNETGNERYDATLQAAFVTSLEQSMHANVYPPSRVKTVLKRMGREDSVGLKIDEDLGREICLRESIKGLVSASIGRVGDRFSMVARLIDPETGESVRSYLHYAESENDILETLGAIAAELRQDLGESLESIQVNSALLPRVTTPSLEALRLYVRGIHAWANLEGSTAVAFMEQAIDLDPDFAMAHAALGTYFYGHMYNDSVRGEEHYQKALARRDRVTERERSLIEAQAESDRGHVKKAIHLYRLYLKSYPDHLGVQSLLARLFMRSDRFVEAIAQYREALRIDPENPSNHINLGVCYFSVGDYEKGISEYDRAFELEPTWKAWGNLNHEYGNAYLSIGQPDSARAIFMLARRAHPQAGMPLRSMGLLSTYEGKLTQAREHLEESAALNAASDLTLSRARDQLLLALLAGAQRDTLAQREGLAAAMATLDPLGPMPTWRSRIAVEQSRIGEVAAADSALTIIEANTDSKNSLQLSELHRLQGEIALARGQPQTGLALLRQACRDKDWPLSRASLAYGYRREGFEEEAFEAARAFVSSPNQPTGWEAQFAWQETQVYLAGAHAARGNAEQARELLEPLVAIWAGADPDFELAQRAARVLAAL